MKTFAIRDERDKHGQDIAYLLYYEKQKTFYIEVNEGMSEWDVPLIISSFVKRNQYTVNAYWSKLWVQQRIVPTDRQNLGQILKDNGLNEYDEFQLLILANGRCAQDAYYLEAVDDEVLFQRLEKRFQTKVEDILPLKNQTALIFFRNGMVRRCSFADYFQKHKVFIPLQKDKEIFAFVRIQPGGYGIGWNESTIISDQELYHMGVEIPVSLEEFCIFAQENMLSTAEVAEELGCSRQNIEDLIKRDKLHPVKNMPRNKLFLKAEIEQRKWI